MFLLQSDAELMMFRLVRPYNTCTIPHLADIKMGLHAIGHPMCHLILLEMDFQNGKSSLLNPLRLPSLLHYISGLMCCPGKTCDRYHLSSPRPHQERHPPTWMLYPRI